MKERVTLSRRRNEEQGHQQEEHSSKSAGDTQGIMDEALSRRPVDRPPSHSQQEDEFIETESRESTVIEPDHSDSLSSAYASTTEQHSSALETPRSCSDCEDDQRTPQMHPSELSSSMDLSEARIKGGKKTRNESCVNVSKSIQFPTIWSKQKTNISPNKLSFNF